MLQSSKEPRRRSHRRRPTRGCDPRPIRERSANESRMKRERRANDARTNCEPCEWCSDRIAMTGVSFGAYSPVFRRSTIRERLGRATDPRFTNRDASQLLVRRNLRKAVLRAVLDGSRRCRARTIRIVDLVLGVRSANVSRTNREPRAKCEGDSTGIDRAVS